MFGTPIVQKPSKTTHAQIFNYNFWKLQATDKDENGIVDLTLKS